jgi:hypothetical protein
MRAPSADLVVEFEPAFGRLVMNTGICRAMCRTGPAIGATTANRNTAIWRYRACGPFVGHAHHVSATVERRGGIRGPVFEQLGVFPDDRRAMLAKRDHVRAWRACDHAAANGFRCHLFRIGSGRTEGRDSSREGGISRGHHRARGAGRRLVPALGHHPEQGAARTGAALPAHAGSATSLAVELRGDAPLSALLHGVDTVIAAQDRYCRRRCAQSSRIDPRPRRVAGCESHRGAALWTDRASWCRRRACFSPPDRGRGMWPPSKWIMSTCSTAIPS